MAGAQSRRDWERDPVTGVIRGAEPFVFDGGKGNRDAILFLHGWTSTPRELRFLAERAAQAGFRCEGLLLPGHGTRVEDLIPTRFPDYLAASQSAFAALQARHERVFICGLSMGGLLGLHLALTGKVAGLVLIAPFLVPSGSTFGIPNRWLIGRVPLPAMLGKSAGGPIEDPQGKVGHIAYSSMPSASMVSVVEAARRLKPSLATIQSPTLIFHSHHDHTSDVRASRILMQRLASEDKRLILYERGNHVITLDYPRPQLEADALAWLEQRRSH